MTPLATIAGTLQSKLDAVQSQLTSLLDAYSTGANSTVPFLGNKLGDAAQVVNRFGSQLHNALNALGNTDYSTSDALDAAIRGALGPALGSSGLQILADQSGAVSTTSTTDASDILLSHPAGLGTGGVEVEMRLHAGPSAYNGSVDFATGLSGLPIQLTAHAGINVSAGFDFELAFTYNANSGAVALDPAKTLPSGHELAVAVTASLPSGPNGFSAIGTIGFIRGTLTPVSNQANALTATAYADHLDSTVTVGLTLTADANLRMAGGFSDIAGISGSDFPSVGADFHLHWQFDSANPTAGKPSVSFDNVGMNLGGFLNKMLTPVLNAIHSVTDIIQPALDVLNAPLPVLSDLSHVIGQGDVNLVGLAKLVAPFAGLGPLVDLVAELDNIVTDIDMVQTSADGVTVPLGGFDLNNSDVRGAAPAGLLSDPGNLTNLSPSNVIAAAQSFSTFVSSLNVPQGVKDALSDLTAGLTNGVDFEFPIFNNPTQAIFALLLGKDADLFTMKAEMHLSAEEHANDFSVFGMGLDFGGAVKIDGKFTFAYDTYGLREMLNQATAGTLSPSKVASDITDGFYVGDDSYLNIAGNIGVSAGVTAGFFGVSVGGGISTADGGHTPLSFTTNDPNPDGKLRFSEIPSNPLDVFNASGELDAGLGIQLKIGVKVLGHFVGYEKDFDIAHTVLVSFPPQHPPQVTLASQADSNGNVTLYIGALANNRQLVDQTDGNEDYVIRHVGDDSDGETIAIDAFNKTQIIHHVKKILGTGDVGTLRIVFDPGLTSAATITGGQGSATLIYSGKGTATLTAGGQDSNLTGGDGSNVLTGGSGNDTLTTGSGDNVIVDTAGNNTIALAGAFKSLTLTNTSPGHNTLEITATKTTTRVAVNPSGASVDVVIGDSVAPDSHAVLANFVQLLVNAHGRSGVAATGLHAKAPRLPISIGELSSTGIRSETVDGTGGTIAADWDANGATGPDALALGKVTETYPVPDAPSNTTTEDGDSVSNIATGITLNVYGVHSPSPLWAALTVRNNSAFRDVVYAITAAGDLIFKGDFSINLGWQLLSGGTVFQPQTLLGFDQPKITLDLSSASQTAAHVLFDGTSDPAGAAYNIGGGINADREGDYYTVGPYFGQAYSEFDAATITLKTYSYRSQDEVTVELPGGSVDAQLDRTSLGTFTIDGSMRLAGTNPTAPNTVTAHAPAGSVSVRAIGDNRSVVSAPNPLYILGSILQDSLTVDQATNFKVAAVDDGGASHRVFVPYLQVFELGADILGPHGYHSTLVVFDSPAVGSIPPLGPYFYYLVPGPLAVTLNPLPPLDPPYSYGQTYPSWSGEYDRSGGTFLDNPPTDYLGSPYSDLSVDYFGDAGDLTYLFHQFAFNPHPVPVDNSVNIDGSQLRGAISYTADEPDYSIANQLVAGLGPAAAAFGQTAVTLSGVNPQSQVTITGQDVLSAPSSSSPNYLSYSALVDNRIPTTSVNVGGGMLANLQANVTVHNAALQIDDRDGALPSILTLTGTSLTGWQTAAGTTHPSLSFDSSLHDDFVITGSPVDRFDIENTPVTGDAVIRPVGFFRPQVHHTLIENFAESGAPADVYLMGQSTQALSITGNFFLTVGRRLHSDGTVDNVGLVNGVFYNHYNNASQPVTFDYRGAGRGTLVFDLSHEIATSHDQILSNGDFPGHGYLRPSFITSLTGDPGFNDDAVVFNANTDLFYYGGIADANSYSVDIYNTIGASIHFIVNPTSLDPTDQTLVYVLMTNGPVDVQGNGVLTRVRLDPQVHLSDGRFPSSASLADSITADVSVSDSQLTIKSDYLNGTAPTNLPHVVLTGDQLTGVTGAAIHFANLVDVPETASRHGAHGLQLQLPTFAATTLVQDTPGGVATDINTHGTSTGPVQILGTTGTLWLGYGDYFAAASVTLGNGTLQAIAGAVVLGLATSVPTAIDDHADSSRQVSFAYGSVESYSGYLQFHGLAPAVISYAAPLGSSDDLIIRGPSQSQYAVSYINAAKLYAGAGSTVDLTAQYSSTYGLDILGARSIRLGLSYANAMTVEADPARPTDVTDLTLTPDTSLFGIENPGGGFMGIDGQRFNQVRYQSNTTRLTVESVGSFTIKDTGLIGTTIEPTQGTVYVQGTTGPLTITQGANAARVAVGNNGSLQAINGEVDIVANNLSLPSLPVVLDDSADNTARSIHVSTDQSNNLAIGGLSPAVVHVLGNQASITMSAGSGANTLFGPDIASVWQISGVNRGTLNDNLSFSGIGSLTGGALDDRFAFGSQGSATGNLDGGQGVNSIDFSAVGLTGNEPFDLAHGIVPLVGGLASNIQHVTPQALAPIDDQTTQAGTPLPSLPVHAVGTGSFSATGLPDGLSIDPQTGLISGTSSESAAGGSPHDVHVSLTDGSSFASRDFLWSVLPGLVIADPGTQITDTGVQVALPLQIATVYGLPLTVTAEGLPDGLSIDSQTGLISGAIAAGADQNSPYHVVVTATDGLHDTSMAFQWVVHEYFAIINPGHIVTPEGNTTLLAIQVDNPANLPLTFSATNLPPYLTIDSTTGVISGSIFFYHYYYGIDENFPVTVWATHGTTAVSASFTWSTEPGFSVTDPGAQTNRTGDPVGLSAGLYSFYGNPYGHTFSLSASNLPPGLTFDPTQSVISGTIDDHADAGSPYHTAIDIVDQTINYSYRINFLWNVEPSILLADPGTQSSVVGSTIDLPMPVTRGFGLPVTYSASGLPLGLSIDPTSGEIRGTLAPQDSSPEGFSVTVYANDGTNFGQRSFSWNVVSATTNVVQLIDRAHGGVITLTSPPGTTLTASMDDLPYYDPTNPQAVLSFPIRELHYQISGLAPGAAASLIISPPAGHPWDHFFVPGPGTGDPAAAQHDFLYQNGQAGSTGAEFLPNGQIAVHLVDGGDGDSDQTADGVINSSGAPAFLTLNVAIVGAPSESWPAGMPLTLTAQLAGAAAADATLNWQVQAYDYRSGYVPTLYSSASSLTFTPNDSGGIRAYYVYLTVTSADRQSSVSLFKSFYVFDPSLGYAMPPLDHFDFSALPTDIIGGESFGGPVSAENSSYTTIADFSDPVSGQITDSSGQVITSFNGAFTNGVFTVPSQLLIATGSSPATYTLSLTCDGITQSTSIAVHPVTHFVPVSGSVVAAGAGQPFDLTLLAESEDGRFASTYAGPVSLSYTDGGGVHDVGGGPQMAAGGKVTFHHVVLPAQGVYLLRATSGDGSVTGRVPITVPVMTGFAAAADAPATVVAGNLFDFGIVAQDALGQTVSNYSGVVVLTVRDSNGYAVQTVTEPIAATDLGHHVFRNLNLNSDVYTLTVSDGAITNNFSLNVVSPNSVVIISDDDGYLSLRQAILNAFGSEGPAQPIAFLLPAGSQTINLLTPLPEITGPLVFVLDASQHVKIQSPPGQSWINSSMFTVRGAGTLDVDSGIEGAGDLTVDSGGSLTVGHVALNNIVIGGPGAPATLTLAPSDASGNPLGVAGTTTTAAAATSIHRRLAALRLPHAGDTSSSVTQALSSLPQLVVSVAAGSSPDPQSISASATAKASPVADGSTPTSSEIALCPPGNLEVGRKALAAANSSRASADEEANFFNDRPMTVNHETSAFPASSNGLSDDWAEAPDSPLPISKLPTAPLPSTNLATAVLIPGSNKVDLRLNPSAVSVLMDEDNSRVAWIVADSYVEAPASEDFWALDDLLASVP